MDQINIMLCSDHGENLLELEMGKNIILSLFFLFKVLCVDEASQG